MSISLAHSVPTYTRLTLGTLTTDRVATYLIRICLCYAYNSVEG